MLQIIIHSRCIHTQHIFAVVSHTIRCRRLQGTATTSWCVQQDWREEESKLWHECQPLSTNLAKSAADWFSLHFCDFLFRSHEACRAWNTVKHNLQVYPQFFSDFCSIAGNWCTALHIGTFSFRSSCSPIGLDWIVPEYFFKLLLF